MPVKNLANAHETMTEADLAGTSLAWRQFLYWTQEPETIVISTMPFSPCLPIPLAPVMGPAPKHETRKAFQSEFS